MKRIQETRVENTFQVEAIISVLRDMRLWEHPATGPAARERGVVYDFWQLFFLESGHYNCRMEGCEPWIMEPGQLLICEPRKVRFSVAYDDAVAAIINIRCASPRLKEMKNRVFTLQEQELEAVRHILDLGTAMFRKIPAEQPFRGHQPQEGTTDWQLQFLKNHIELLLIRLYGQFCQEKPPALSVKLEMGHEAKFYQIRSFLQAHIRQRLTVSDICRGTGCSESTLKRVFESQADCGVIHYFLTMKIGEAKRLLGDTDMTVTEIAEYLGFSSVHYFSRLFKQLTGRSPNGFRAGQK